MPPPNPVNFLLGVNYWPRRKAMYWWKSFDRAEIEEEFSQIAAWGLHIVRFCLLWEDFQPTEQSIDPVQLRNLGTVMDVADACGLMAIPTLLVGNMSGPVWFPRWAFTDQPESGPLQQISGGHTIHLKLRSIFDEPAILRAQCLFARESASTVAHHPALHSWDLANEIDQALIPPSADSGWLWAWCVSESIRAADGDALVTYGAHALSLTTNGLTLPALSPSLDYLSMHGYPIYNKEARGPLDTEWVPYVTALTQHLGDKPTLMQEFGLCTAAPGESSHTVEDDFMGTRKPQFMASEEDAAEYYRVVLDRLWEIGALGALAWDYADYTSDLWSRPPLDRAIRERTFGIFRADGSPKPAAEVMRRFARELESGALEHRLGPHGAKRITFTVHPEAYYLSPAESLRQEYRHYLTMVEQVPAGSNP